MSDEKQREVVVRLPWTADLKPGDKVGIISYNNRAHREGEVKKITPSGQIVLTSGQRFKHSFHGTELRDWQSPAREMNGILYYRDGLVSWEVFQEKQQAQAIVNQREADIRFLEEYRYSKLTDEQRSQFISLLRSFESQKGNT